MNKKKAFYIILLISCCMFLFSCANVKQDTNNNEINDTTTIKNDSFNDKKNLMDDFSCETNKGEIFKLYERNDGKPVFINFWATWCGPCVGEMPDLQKIYDEYNNDMDFIFINGGDNRELIASFLSDSNNQYTFPIGYDENMELCMKFNVTAIPKTYIIDKNNKICEELVGARSGDEYKKIIDDLLSK